MCVNSRARLTFRARGSNETGRHSRRVTYLNMRIVYCVGMLGVAHVIYQRRYYAKGLEDGS